VLCKDFREKSSMSVDKFINKSFNMLNGLIDKNDLTVRVTNLLNEFLETLKIMENCINCKDNMKRKCYSYEFNESLNGIKDLLVELEEEQEKENTISNLSAKSTDMNDKLNKWILCEDCQVRKIEKLSGRCGNEEIAMFLYECKLNIHNNSYYNYIEWIPFDEFRNIEYLDRGGFGEVYKATWMNYYHYNSFQ